jgi:hypothetical protein
MHARANGQGNEPLTAFFLRYERQGEMDLGFSMNVTELRLYQEMQISPIDGAN